MRLIYAAAPLALMAFGCAVEAPPVPDEVSPAIDLVNYRVIDLTHSYGPDTVYWPTAPSEFELEQLAYGETEGGFFYSANAIRTPEHGGTHLDAPIHFGADGWTVDAVPLEGLIGPAVVLDVAASAGADTDYRLNLADVSAWEAEHGEIAEGAIVLLRTGWSGRWPDRLAYLGDDTPGNAANLHFPSYGEDAARLLVEERRVAVLGVDTASIDYGPSTDFPVHRIAAEHNVSGLENVRGLDRLPSVGAWVMALPMKIEGGSGGPVRIAALVPRLE